MLDAVLRMRTHERMIQSDFPRRLLVPHLTITDVLGEDQFIIVQGLVVVVVDHA